MRYHTTEPHPVIEAEIFQLSSPTRGGNATVVRRVATTPVHDPVTSEIQVLRPEPGVRDHSIMRPE
jgi:hypothetical protein